LLTLALLGKRNMVLWPQVREKRQGFQPICRLDWGDKTQHYLFLANKIGVAEGTAKQTALNQRKW